MDLWELEAILVFMSSSRPARALHQQNNNNNLKKKKIKERLSDQRWVRGQGSLFSLGKFIF